MRKAWKSPFFRTISLRISSQISRSLPPNLQVKPSQLPIPRSISLFHDRHYSAANPRSYSVSSIPAVDPASRDRDQMLLTSVLTKQLGRDEMKAELDNLDVAVDYQMVISVLGKLEGSPEIAGLFFDWVSSKEGDATRNRLLTAKSYNLMICIVSTKGKADGLWGLIEAMRKRGYSITEESFLKASERFKREKMVKELNLLNEMYSTILARDVSWKICKVLREEEELKAIQQALNDLGISVSADLAVAVLDRIHMYPKKAILFFNWVEKNPSFEIDGKIYNTMARVLARVDCVDDFWSVLRKMRSSGFGLEMETYFTISNSFLKQRMASEAVDLYEFVMAGTRKPPVTNFLILLKKVVVSVVSEDLDMSMVSKVVRIFTGAGNHIKASAFGGVLKSLSSVGRLGECEKILKAMEEGGFKCDDTVHDRVVVALSYAGKLDEALKYVVALEKAGGDLYLKGWTSIIHKHSLAGQLDEAVSCFNMMVERKGGENAGPVFELLVNDLCSAKGTLYACKVLKNSVANKNWRPWHSTYKVLIKRLIDQEQIKEAAELLGLMRSHGFPPFIDPFIEYVSKSGTANDASIFLKAMTIKKFPSRAVYVRIFEALFKAGKHRVAHDVLSIAPGCVRNHEDVLDLFYSMKPDEAAVAVA